MNFKERTLNFDYKLTELEDDFVEYILTNKKEAAHIKITVLASKFYCVPNSITRFCHKLGYEGFADLKAELKWEVEREKESKHLSSKDYLLKNIRLIDREREEKCVRLFNEVKTVSFFAIGQTGELSKICVDNFYALDPKFIFTPYPNTVSQRISHGEGEIFFFISLSGESEGVIKLATQAKEKGHYVVSLTHLSKNTLSKISDLTLFCFTESKIVDGYNVTDKTPLMIIMNSLFEKYLESRTV